MKSFSFHNPSKVKEALEKLESLKQRIPHRALIESQTEQCFGDHIFKSKNCFYCFDVNELEDCFYNDHSYRTKDSAEITFADTNELCYECFSITGGYNVNFSNYTRNCKDCGYCELCFSCRDCFGCVGLQNKQYYILNKPYPKEEYFKKVREIKEELKRQGLYGRYNLGTTYKFEDTAAAS